MAAAVLALAGAVLPSCSCGDEPATGRGCITSADCEARLECVDGRCRGSSVDGGECVDRDGDGRGNGCLSGPDCDDTDPTQLGVETCDGADNDCDGTVDEGVLSACGDCDPLCTGDSIGGDHEDAFDLVGDESEGVSLDDDGALVLDSERINTAFIWVANTADGTVSKIDTRTFEEVGRYHTGPDGPANDPSRTSVNTVGDVYVGNRNGNTVTRISVLGAACPDTNGDGAVTTSTGRHDVLPWGMDDCVLWTTDLGAVPELSDERHIRAVAAQDVEGLDLELSEYVWIGAYDRDRVVKLDGETGEVLLVTPSPVRPYGFALDAAGNLWITSNGAGHGESGGFGFGRLDTTRCTDAASCDVPVCDGDEGECDDAVKERIRTNEYCYGVTVDFRQRVWVSGRCMDRYDPAAPAGSRHVEVCPGLPPFGEDPGNCDGYDPFGMHGGIAADAEGWVWAAGRCHGVFRFDGEDPMTFTTVDGTVEDLMGARYFNKGVALDVDGKVWVITRYHDRALVLTPGPAIDDVSIEEVALADVDQHYTYSDMTGLQLRLATNRRGHYRHVFDGCADWRELRWSADIPPGTSVVFRVRSADTREGLAMLDFATAATVPPDAPPVDVLSVLEGAGMAPGRLLEVEVVLRAERTSTTAVITPRVHGFSVTHSCAVDPA